MLDTKGKEKKGNRGVPLQNKNEEEGEDDDLFLSQIGNLFIELCRLIKATTCCYLSNMQMIQVTRRAAAS